MPTVLPILKPTPIFEQKDYDEVLRRESVCLSSDR